MSGIDWPGMVVAGLHRLGLRPTEFWALTPAELMTMLGVQASQGALSRERLEALAREFPDSEREQS